MALAALLVSLSLLCACASSKDFEHGRDAAREGEWDEAIAYFDRALADDPENLEYRMALQRARLEASHAHQAEARKHRAAGALDAARAELALAVALDPSNRYLFEELAELRDTSERTEGVRRLERGSPILDRRGVLDPASPEPLRLFFPEGTSVRKILESLAKLGGVNILFDDSFRDQRISVDLKGVSFREALDILMQTNGLFYKVVGPSYVVTRVTFGRE